MFSKRFNEERCGKIATDGLHQTKKELNTLDRSGYLLSCGGAYISPSEGNIVKTEYSFLSLPSRGAPPVLLKNLRIEESLEGGESMNPNEQEESKENSFKYRRKKINPEQLH